MTKTMKSLGLRSLCVFCGSSAGDQPAWAEGARILGRQLAREDITLIFGGGHLGIMGALAEAVLAEGGRVIGIIPEHLTRIEAAFTEVTELHIVDSMHTRKRRMFDMADAFAVLPGGMGTMDETFEILTWKQLRLHNKPIIIWNQDEYWSPLVSLFDHIIANNFARAETARLYHIVERVDQVVGVARREVLSEVSGESKLF